MMAVGSVAHDRTAAGQAIRAPDLPRRSRQRQQKRRRQPPDRKAVGRDGAEGEAVDQQGGRVVQQALAFEDREDAMRRPQLAEHRGRGDGVGRSDDGAQRDRRRPRHRRHERARDDGDGERREADREDDQPVTGAQLSLRSRSDAS